MQRMSAPSEAFSARLFIAGFAGVLALVLLLGLLWQWGMVSGALDWLSRQKIQGSVTFATETPLHENTEAKARVLAFAKSGETCKLVQLEPQKTFAWFKASCGSERLGWFRPMPEDKLNRSDTKN